MRISRAIYVGRIASYQAKQHQEMQAVAEALSLLANLCIQHVTDIPHDLAEEFAGKVPALLAPKSRGSRIEELSQAAQPI